MTASRAAATSICLFLLALLAMAPGVGASPLRPDPSFGTHGVAEPQLPPHYGYTSFLALAPQPDGSLLAARHDAGNGAGLLTYRRYDTAGRLDPGFEPTSEMPTVEAVDAEGKILRANSNSVQRFNPDGTLDPGFGTDPTGGRPFSDILSFKIEELLPAPSGKFFVAGSILSHSQVEEAVEQIVVARFDHQGRLDPSFGGDGLAKLGSEAGVAGERLVGVSGRGEEGIVALLDEEGGPEYEGQEVSPGGSAVVALAADGRLDTGFGEGGVVRSASSIEAYSALPEGGFMLTGNRWEAKTGRARVPGSDLYAARLTPTGGYDPGFDGDGVAIVDFGGVDLSGAMLADADGSVLIGGSSTAMSDRNCLEYEGFCRETPVLARLLANGAPDPGFGGDGSIALEPLSEPFVGRGTGRGVRVLAAAPGGGVLAGGGSGTAAFMAELESGGALAADFGSGGIVTERDGERADAHVHAVAVDGRDRILVAGSTDANALYSTESGAVFRFRPGGRLDPDYGEGRGYVRVPGNTRDIAAGHGGDAFLLSGEYAPNIVVHVTPRGILDPRFGEDGVAPLPELPAVRRQGKRRGRYFDPRSLAALPGGGVLVGGESGGSGSEARIVLARYDRRGRLNRRFGKGGVAILALGRTGQCNVTQLDLRPDGRIVIAGRIRERGSPGPWPALFQLRADGSPDPSFGRGGVVKVGLETEGVASSLAIQPNGSILLAGRQTRRGKSAPLLLRFGRNGAPDRRFARRMRTSLPAARRDEGIAPRQILATRKRIFTVAPYRPVLAFSSRGSFLGTALFGPRKKPRVSPIAAAIQAGRPLLAGVVGRGEGLSLRRYLTR